MRYGLRQGDLEGPAMRNRHTMSDLLMRGRSLRIVAVGLQPQLQSLAVADSLAARIAAPTTRATQTRPQRRRHALDPDEQWQPSHESGPASIQAGRSPP